MTKYLLLALLTLSLFPLTAIHAEENENTFEAELQMLERQDEAAFARAEAVTEKELHQEVETLTDTVSTASAAVKKEEGLKQSDSLKPYKSRRIRSR